MKFTNDRGDSLLEVVISTVIMGIIGVLLISSIAVARPFADKMSTIGQTVQNLNTLAESINLQGFTPCSSEIPQPYGFGQLPASSGVVSPTFAITTTELPPIMVSTTGHVNNYSAQLSLVHAPGTVTWSVEPALPIGINLNASTGLISGSSNQALTSEYVFTATSGSEKASKNLILTSASVLVQVNNGSGWVSCASEPAAFISKVSGDGTVATYNYVGKQLVVGDVITVWGSSNSSFNGNSLKVTKVSPGTFSTASTVIGSGTGGTANLATTVNIQQIIVSTVVAGSPLTKIVTKAMP